jgi:hypothetical protein
MELGGEIFPEKAKVEVDGSSAVCVGLIHESVVLLVLLDASFRCRDDVWIQVGKLLAFVNSYYIGETKLICGVLFEIPR